jgi:hypothetical protein
MRHIVLLGLTFLAFPSALKAVRLESTRLEPSASVWFEANAGQVKGRTEFVGRTRGAFLYMTGREVVYAMPPAKIEFGAKMRRVRMEFAGAALTPAGTGEEATGGYSNYFVGKSEKDWFTGVSHYGRLRYRQVYPGIDVVYYGADGAIEFDFIAKPGADVSKIGMRFHGATSVDVDEDVYVKKDGAEMRVRRPRVFQGGIEIPSWYEMVHGVVKVRMAEIDPAAALTIDPMLDFSTYLGGPGVDGFVGLALAPDGNPIIAGTTQSPASPQLDPFQQPSVVSLAPIVLKMSADGRRILFYTILGRNGWDTAKDLAIAKDGTIVTAGDTRSGFFPMKNAFQSEFRAIWDNAFVTRVSADGRTLLYSSYLGGTNREQLNRLTLDDFGNAYFVGNTQSIDFPTVGAMQARIAGSTDCFVSKVSPDGKLLFSTYYGGSGLDGFWDVKWRADDRTLILTGEARNADFPLKDPIQSVPNPRPAYANAALVMISDDGATLKYGTFFNGTAAAGGLRLAIDARARIYVVGSLDGRGFPLKDPLSSELGAEGNGFLAIFDRSGRDILLSTLLPGCIPLDIRIADDGGIVLAGTARSTDFILKDSLQNFRYPSDGFVLKLSEDGRAVRFSTLLGGSGMDWVSGVALASNGAIYGAGRTGSPNFLTRNPYQPEIGGGDDGALFRITDDAPALLPSFAVSPGRAAFRYVQGDALPAAVAATVSGLTGSLVLSSVETWLRVTPGALAGPGAISIGVNPTGLAPGVYQGTVRLTPAAGTAGTVEVVLTVLAAAPLLTAVEPGRVAIGSDDTEITLRGIGFTNRTTVQLDTIAWMLTPVRFVDATTLRLTLPKMSFSAEYNFSITVSNPDSAVSKPVSLSVGRPAPSIAAKGIVSAASYAGDVISPGEILTLFGENFEQGMRVNFDGLLATPLYITPGQLSVVAPTGLAGGVRRNPRKFRLGLETVS